MIKWRRKSDGLECDVVEAAWDKVQKGAHPGAMLARILPHLPIAAQQAALGDGWEPCGEAHQAPQTAHVAQEPPPTPLGGWHPIETAPKDGTWVLAWDFRIGGRPYIITGCSARSGATHWQPLPEPPVA